MANIFQIAAEKREKTGKSSTGAIRRDGKLPAIIYGNKTDNHAIAIDKKEITKRYKRGYFLTQVCEISFGDKKIQTLPKSIDLHPVTDNIEHIDFYELKEKEKVKIRVNVKFLHPNRCKGVKKGGVVNVAARQIELLCYPANIVHEIEVDLMELDIGESIHIHNLELPEGTEPANKNQDTTIVTIVGRAEEKLDEPVGDAVGEAGKEEAEEGGDEAKADDKKEEAEKKEGGDDAKEEKK